MAYPTTTAQGIILTRGSYSVTIDTFASSRPGQYPRLEAQYLNIEYSINGGARRIGPSHRPKAVWTFQARLDLTQQEALKRLEAAYLTSPGAITLYDYTNPFAEVGGATMSTAPNSTTASDGTTVLYYPVWEAELTQPITWTEDPQDGYDVVSLQLKEV